MQQESGEDSWYEEQCHREINAQNDEIEREYVRHRDSSLSQVWSAFQDSATAVAHLYRERSSNIYPDTGALWLPFQSAAGTVTKLYEESCEGVKRTGDAAIHCGYQRRTRELAEWARSEKRRMIRREDLLAYLAGKPLPPFTTSHNNRRSPKPEQSLNHGSNPDSMFTTSFNSHNSLTQHSHNHSMHHHHSNYHHHTGAQNTANEHLNDLHTFKEALVLKPRGPELFAFVANEIVRHCKRPASPIDDKMDVCHCSSSKRQRFM
ncbi:HUWE1-associated protein modifying stress responses-like [Glossina fuscipes fuscipes]